MHQNRIWLGFLGLFALITLWYTSDAAWQLWRYQSLTATTAPTAVTFSAHEVSSDKFFIRGTYTFSVNDQTYEGSTILHDALFRNRPAAERAAATELPHTVFYAPSNPHLSTLEKAFPFKECLYATILMGVLLYFIWIGVSLRSRFL